MSLKFTVDINDPSIGALAAIHMVRDTIPVEIKWSNECSMQYANGSIFECYHHNDGLRILAYTATEHRLYGTSLLESIQIDNWLTWCLKCDENDSLAKLGDLNRFIATLTYLVSNKITIADLALYHTIITNYRHLIADGGLPQHVQRWYNLINAQPFVQAALESLPEEAKVNYKTFINKTRKSQQQQQGHSSNGEEGQVKQTKASTRKQEGKFIDLPGAEMGKVVVRFPPEASGYLHIGHAKAALLNQYYAQAFNGKLIMRFDDTNPAKETTEFEEVILGDLELLQIKPDVFTHTSNYFDIMLEYCEQLIKDGKAYVDDTSAEQMKIEREQKAESKNRSNDVEKNMSMWQEMLTATEYGQTCCVRAKIDMNSANGCMRDPTIYRCKTEPHPRTDTKYKVYPTYDFACPIVDALENVTHTLRTMEYHDRDEQFYWFIDALKLRKPYIWEYSRLNMTNTVLSKRKLTWFVENGLVDDWDDPRFPTVRGIIRRGMTVEGLKEFIIAQGSSKAVVFMNWDKIWAFNKKVIDPIAPRYTALEYENRIVVNVAGIHSIETVDVAIHPKNEALGKKTITVGPKVYIDYEDALALKEEENATFINWGNLMIKKIHKDGVSGRISSIDATLNLDNKDYKKTLKLTWIAVEEDDDVYPPTFCVYFDNIISKPVLGKDEDFKQYIDHTTREEVHMLGEPAMKNCKKGDIIQLQRRGFFKVDNAYTPASPYSNAISPIILFSIPDGHTKQMPMSGLKINATITQNTQVEKVNKTVDANESIDSGKLIQLNDSIIQQGNLIRNLKSQNAAKSDIEANVKILLKLKSDYKELSGKEWKPGITTPNTTTNDNNSLNSASQEGNTHSNKQQLSDRITFQGDKVRQLKTEKADKSVIDAEVKILLQLKAEYKEHTGIDWKPNISSTINAVNNLPASPVTIIKQEKFPEKPTATVITELLNKIQQQGDKIRQLKTNKADKASINPEVQLLLALKADYKSLTNEEWQPNITPPITSESNQNQQIIDLTDDSTTAANEISQQIKSQGDKVRKLKSEKAAKADIAIEVQHLLSLKAEYKTATGKDWVPETTPNPEVTPHEIKSPTNMSTLSEKELLMQAINEQGEKVRNAKANKVDKADIDTAVAKLLALKAKYKEVTGTDYPVAGRGTSSSKKPAEKKEQKSNKKDLESPATSSTKSEITSATPKKQTRLGLEATKEDNLADWYSQVITKGELIEYYDVSGCYILRHWSFAIWKFIKNWFDNEITKMGVKECYFPIFVSKAALEREKAHIADFAPEVAWVTKSGESDLAEPIAVRPTSETVMYPAFAKWIQSYRDLPIRLNQWNNVVRWEFKHPQPFLRTREFLWQEGHTAFANKEDADKEVLDILDLYAQVYTDLLAIPVVKGRKTEKEKFAGSSYTTTVEAFISASGRGIQGATSHHLGQNFSKMFEIVYEDPDTQQKQYVYQNSWGITTRTIGVMIMVHADNQGIVLPPRVACIQAIIVPCGLTVNTKDTQRTELLDTCCKLEKLLIAAGIRCEGDYRDNYTPGWKFNHWELKGVPVRIELGPKDMEANQIVAVRRDTGEKLILAMDAVEVKLKQLLETIHDSMLARATEDLKTHTILTKNWSDFCKYLDQKNILLAPFCGEISCEEKIKANSAREEDAEPGAPSMGAKSLCIPFDQPAAICPSDKCIHPGCTNKPMSYTLFGRSY